MSWYRCLWGISSNINPSRSMSSGVFSIFSHSRQLPLMAQEGRDKSSLLGRSSFIGLNLVQVIPGSDLGLVAIFLI